MLNSLSVADIDRLIAEDLPYGDLTTQALSVGGQRGAISFAARADLIVCASEEAALLFERLGAATKVLAGSGTPAVAGTPLLRAEGEAAVMFAGWKVAQTLMEWSSGIASAAAQLVGAARRASPRIVVACTRKTVPFNRHLCAKAVHAGGAGMHRLGLSESVLLFPEHRLFSADGLVQTIARLRAQAPERSIVVETTDVEDALTAAAHADVVQLEKFSVEQTVQVVARIRKREDGRPIVAAAGGITAGNAAQYAAAGVDVLVSSWPYQAPPRDVQVTFSRI